MSVPLLEAIADAIYQFEGAAPVNLAYRNRNPGNLRPTSVEQPRDQRGLRRFSTFIEGYQALLDDLRAKVSGHNRHGLGLSSCLDDLFAVYAPVGDGNEPSNYAAFVAQWLTEVYGRPVTPRQPFLSLYHDVAQEAPPNGVTTPPAAA